MGRAEEKLVSVPIHVCNDPTTISFGGVWAVLAEEQDGKDSDNILEMAANNRGEKILYYSSGMACKCTFHHFILHHEPSKHSVGHSQCGALNDTDNIIIIEKYARCALVN